MVSTSTRGRVLIADDDPIIRTVLMSIVTNEGFDAVQVTDGREAFRLLQTDSRFAGALFDLRMPGLNGIDLVSHMQTEKRLQRIPVMLITADTDARILSDVFSAGAAAYLPKPFTRDQVRRAVRMLLRNSAIRRPAIAA